MVPIIGQFAAGKPILADEHIEAYLPCEAGVHADFGLIVSGDSMIGADIHDGDVVFICIFSFNAGTFSRRTAAHQEIPQALPPQERKRWTTTLTSAYPLRRPGLKKMQEHHLREFQKILIKIASSSSNARFLPFVIPEQQK